MHSGEHTKEKQRIFAGLVRWHLGMCTGIYRRYPALPYLYVDMNAADGTGSPSIFLDAAQHVTFPWRAIFIEMDAEAVQILTATCEHPDATCFHDDHTVLLPQICDRLRGLRYGLIYHDPYGIPSFDTLRDVSARDATERIDILIRCPATVIKRARGAFGIFGKHKYTLTQHLDSIRKKHWLIQAPQGSLQWTFLLGTNYESMKEWRKEHLYRIDTYEGQSILDRLAKTANERQNDGQLPLFDV